MKLKEKNSALFSTASLSWLRPQNEIHDILKTMKTAQKIDYRETISEERFEFFGLKF